MPDEILDAGSADSSTAPATTADPSQATTPPVQNGDPYANVPFHQHPRWQQLMGERKADRETIAELRRQLQGLDQRTQPQPSQDEMQAAEALKRLIGLNPDLKGLLDHSKSTQEITSLKQMVQQMVGHQRNGWVAAGKKEIGAAATRLGVDAGKLEKAVLGFLADDPALYQRFTQGGDTSAITEVLKDIEDNVFGKLTRSATAGLAQTKLTTSKLPPRSAGGLPGEPGHTPWDPEKEPRRERMASLLQRTIAKAREGMTG